MKAFEGKEMIFRPTGNNARRFNKAPITVNIIKVARVFVTFTEVGSTYEQKYRYKGRVLGNGCNGGYVAYATRQEIDEYNEQVELAKKISHKYRYDSDYRSVELGKLKQVAELLGV